jgi:hypothetical protein
MNTIENRIALLRERTPILAGLLLSMHDRPEVAQLDDWVYNCSGSYATLGALLSEMFPAYDGLTISVKTDTHNGKSAFFDGHNAFEEFVISVFDVIAEYHNGFDGHVYDMDAITAGFMQDILPFDNLPDSPDYAEPPTDDTGGGRY